MGVTDVVYELNYFKAKISAILKRHCCHSNGSSVTFVQKFNWLLILSWIFHFVKNCIEPPLAIPCFIVYTKYCHEFHMRISFLTRVKTLRLMQYWWKQDWTMFCCPCMHVVHSCQQYLTIIRRRRGDYRWIKTETKSRFLFTIITEPEVSNCFSIIS